MRFQAATLGITLCVLGVMAIATAWVLSKQAEVSTATTERRGVTGSEGYRDVKFEETGEDALETSYMQRYGAAALGAVGIAGAVLLMLIARDISMVPTSRPAGFERFITLFTYNYDRPFPTHSYNYRPILTGFGFVAVAVCVLLAIDKLRRHGARAMIALAACFAFWGLDKYMMDLSNHWSQRNLFVRYYGTRHDRAEIGDGEDGRYWADAIVAYQMNWKGENFYTGNHAAMLECGLPLCHERTNEWLQRHRGEHVFFVTEHSRASSVIGQVRQVNPGAHAQTVTDEFDNNKFVLVEAQL
jgi:hypothetical protein